MTNKTGYSADELPQWFVMRDLKRRNAKKPAYKMLSEKGIEIFTPLISRIRYINRKKVIQEVPYIQDLLFAHACKKELDIIVDSTETLQYRFLRDGKRTPMTVSEKEMERFIQAVKSTVRPCYYKPQEITPDMVGKNVRIIGGPLNNYEGRLQKMQGSRIKRLFIELPQLLTVAVEVEAEFIQVLKK